MEFLIGAVGAVSVMLLFAAGIFVGWKLRAADEKRRVRKTAAELTEQQVREMKEQQEAFRQMQNYTPEIAYGYKVKDALGGDHVE